MRRTIDIKTCADRFQRGETLAVISREICVSIPSLRDRLIKEMGKHGYDMVARSHMGANKNAVSRNEALIRQMVNMWLNGLTYEEISEQCYYSPYYIKDIVQKHATQEQKTERKRRIHRYIKRDEVAQYERH